MKKKIKIKSAGSSIYIYIPMLIVFIIILFYLNMYTRAADTVSDNLKTSLDASALSATVVNMDQLIKEGKLSINGYSTADSGWNPQEYMDTDGNVWTEKTIVIKRFISFEKALKSNVGLTNDFTFRGGTCGWAADFIEDNGKTPKFTIDEFILYDFADNTVVSYTAKDITSYTETPTFQKNTVGTVIRGDNDKVIKSTAYTPEGYEIKEPTIYVKVSFPVKTASIFNDPSFVSEDVASQDHTFRVSKSSTTNIRSNKK